ncbi:hypothetical protein ACFSUS_18950 [Spirosoma soli]|uniref:Outer membrane protein beta-barrel domain-containing protein n=1 Tax=Spirosoma soli TaxID=1770529 RepID=A0ABW5M8M3_9BACT
MNNIYLLLFLFLVTLELNAQDAPAERPAKAIYVEGLGSGLGVSLNYDTRFKPGLSGLGLRVGVGGLDVSSSAGSIDIITLPVLVNYVAGNSRAAFEAGVGVTVIRVSAISASTLPGDNIVAKGTGVAGSGNFGLRVQPKRNGVHFRLYWSPFVTSDIFEPRIFGASLGFGFR